LSSATIHLVYPHGPRVSAPDAIGRELGRRLERRHPVRYHDWDETGVITPEPGDVLLGHPHPSPRTVFRRSLDRPGWRRRLMLAPFSHGDLGQVAFEDPIVRKCDKVLAITGHYWWETVSGSACSHWQPKMVHLDLAVDRSDFPVLDRTFAPPGRRRVLYIGSTAWWKNTPYLSAIADRLPGVEFGWMGAGPPIRGFDALGYVDFATPEGRATVSRYDFLLTVGRADANPTTILEAMSWGLIPVCTPQSGYAGLAGIPNVPLGNAARAAEIVRGLLDAPDAELVAMQRANWDRLDRDHTWDGFAAKVLDQIEGDDSPPLGRETPVRRARFWFAAATSPYARPRTALRAARRKGGRMIALLGGRRNRP
jgi:glycosyltransferase involved in cell wall biosynthesis